MWRVWVRRGGCIGPWWGNRNEIDHWGDLDVDIYLLTYSMKHSPSSEANWFAASQEIPSILWNPQVHYSTHKRPPPVPILRQLNPVHITTSHRLEIHNFDSCFVWV